VLIGVFPAPLLSLINGGVGSVVKLLGGG
jgi:hypothetical protein